MVITVAIHKARMDTWLLDVPRWRVVGHKARPERKCYKIFGKQLNYIWNLMQKNYGSIHLKNWWN